MILNFTVGTSLLLSIIIRTLMIMLKRRDLIDASLGVPYSSSVTHAYSYLHIQPMNITNYYFATVLQSQTYVLLNYCIFYVLIGII